MVEEKRMKYRIIVDRYKTFGEEKENDIQFAFRAIVQNTGENETYVESSESELIDVLAGLPNISDSDIKALCTRQNDERIPEDSRNCFSYAIKLSGNGFYRGFLYSEPDLIRFRDKLRMRVRNRNDECERE